MEKNSDALQAEFSFKHLPLHIKKAQEMEIKALQWIYRWSWSDSSIIKILCGLKASEICKRLQEKGLIISTKTESGRCYEHIPAEFLTLTKSGKKLVENHVRFEGDLVKYQFDPYRLDQSKMMHGAICQKLTALNLQQGSITEYRTRSMSFGSSKRHVKQHAAIWICENGDRIGFELELTARKERLLDDYVFSCVQSISTGSVSRICIATYSKAIRERYSDRFLTGSEYGIWEKTESGSSNKIGTGVIPPDIDGKISLCLLVKKKELPVLMQGKT